MNYTVPDAKENILSGTKKHTMREDRKERWKAGRLIHHATGARSKKYNCFLQNQCTGVQLVLIVFDKVETKTKLVVTIDRRKISQNEILTLVRNDGFIQLQHFIDWFFPPDPKTGYRKRTLWSGRIIHWTGLKY